MTLKTALLLAVMPGGTLVLAVVGVRWALRRMRARDVARELALVNAEIAARGVRDDGERPRYHGHREDLRQRTEEKRKAATVARRRANAIESGAPLGRILEAVRKTGS